MFGILALVAFAVEEVFHQKERLRGNLSQDPTDEGKHNLDVFDYLRLLQLLFLALIMSTPAGNPALPHGQTSIILTGLQIARLFGRKILSRWSVLGVLQALEVVLLFVIVLLPFSPSAADKPPLTPASVAALAGALVYGILISISAAFSISYWVKLFSRENSRVYDNFPPLADSENWSVKFVQKAVYAGILGAAGLFLISGFSLLSLLFALSVVLNGTGLFLAGKSNFSGHHPISHVFWDASFLLVFTMVAFGVTNFTGS